MIGPSPDARGGMASVLAVYRSHGFFSDGCLFLTTAVEGNRFLKLLAATTSLARFAMMLALDRVNLLHVHGASHGSFWRKRLFMEMAYRFGVPVIFHLHGGEFRQFVETRLSPRRRTKLLQTMARCQQIYCLNQEIAHWLGDWLPEIPVKVMENPIDLPQTVVRDTARAPVLLFAGRIEREKGVFDLLEAFTFLRQDFPEMRMVFCGVGSATTELIKQAAELGLSQHIDFPGWVGGDTKLQFFCTARVFVLPSYAEGMPVSVLEAMACRTPVVASRVGGAPELLGEGKYGFLFTAGNIEELGQAIRRAYTLEPASVILDLAERKVREQFSAEVVLEKLRREYRRLSA